MWPVVSLPFQSLHLLFIFPLCASSTLRSSAHCQRGSWSIRTSVRRPRWRRAGCLVRTPSSFPVGAASQQSRTEAPSSVRVSLTVVDSSESGGKKPLKCQHFIHPCPPGDKDGRLQSPPLRLLVHIHPQVPSPLLSAPIPFRWPVLESERIHWKFALKVWLEVRFFCITLVWFAW